MLTATNISAAEVGQIEKLPANTVLINFNNSYSDLFKLKLDRDDVDNILTLVVDDITGPTKLSNGMVLSLFDEGAALTILNFISLNKSKNFIINCYAGISRSAAVCLFLKVVYGYELKPRFWEISEPNAFILGKLLIERFRK